MSFSLIDWIVVVVYLLGVVGIGIFFSGRQTNSEEFFLGSRRFGAFTISISVLATGLSAITFVGVPGLACLQNWSLFLSGAIGILSILFVAKYFMPFFYELGLPSAYDYLERRFDRRVAWMGGVLFLMIRGLLAGIAIYAPSVALCAVTGWNLSLCILIFGAMTVLYTAIGGMSAVVWTDVLQVLVLFGGAIVSVWILWDRINLPPQEAIAILSADRKFEILDFRWSWVEMTFWTSIIGGFMFNLAAFGTDQVMIQRCMASKSLKASKQSLILNAWYTIPVIVVFFCIGSLLYLFRRANPADLPAHLPVDQIYPYFIAHHMPVGVAGLLIAAIFAAAMSTLSAVLNSLATVTVNDFVKYFRPNLSDERYTLMAKWTTVGWGVVAIALALVSNRLNDSVSLAALKAGSLFSGPVLGMFVAGIFLPWMTSRSIWWGSWAGAVVSLVSGFGTPLDSFWILILGFIVTMGVAGLISALRPATAVERSSIAPYTWKNRVASARSLES